MNTRHRFIGALALLLCLGAVPALAAPAASSAMDWPWSWAEPQQTEPFSKTVALGKTGAVVIGNVSGDIVVTGGAGDQVAIEAVKKGRTAEDLKNVQIDVVTSQGRVEITTRYPLLNRHTNASVSYTVTVPRGASVRAKSVSGDIRITTIDGELWADTVSGDVNIAQAGSLEGAKSVSGDVTVKGASAAGTISVDSVSGDLELSGVKARAVEGNTVSGDMMLQDVTCERLESKSVSGSISFGGPLAKGGRYAIQSHSGDITVHAQNNAGFDLRAGSFSGHITSDQALTMPAGTDMGRGRRRQEIRGTFGDGAAVLELKAFSGDIRITGAAAAPVKK